MGKLWIIARSTFSEIVRQPFYFVILAVAALLTTASPTFSAFTLLNSTKLLRDMGLATILLAGWFLSAVAASQVVSTEIRRRTVLTLLSKPIARWQFIFGKFVGLAGAVTLACALLGAILLIIARFGVPEAAYTTMDWPIFRALMGAYAATIIIGAGANFWFDRPFASTAIKTLAITVGIVLAVFAFVENPADPEGPAYDYQLVRAIVAGILGALVLAAVALAFSTRLTMAATVFASLVVYGVGLIADQLHAGFRRLADWGVGLFPVEMQEGWPTRVLHSAADIAYYLIPNFQVFRVGDVLMEEGRTIPWSYVAYAAGYAAILVGAFLMLAVMLFQEREVS
jgi:hypothetical protein